MARYNNGIYIPNNLDPVPTDAQGGYAGGDSTAAAVLQAGAAANAALTTMETLKVAVKQLPSTSGPTIGISGAVPQKTITIGVPAGKDGEKGADGMGYEQGQQLIATNAQTLAAAQAAQGSAADAAADAQTAMQAQFMTQDEGVAALVETAAGPKTMTALSRAFPRQGEIVLTPEMFDAAPLADGSGGGADSTTAIQAAINYAKSLRTFTDGAVSRRLHLSAWYKISSDIFLNTGDLTITGEGGGSGLLFLNSGLIIDGTAATIQRNQLRDVRIRRVTTTGQSHGPAVAVLGGGMNSGKYPCRFGMHSCLFEAPVNAGGTNPEKSVALEMRGTFLATLVDIYMRNAANGLVVDVDSQNANLSANAINFFGGEIQAVQNLGRITGAIGIGFFGPAWEGASVSGMEVNDTHGLTIVGPYFEAVAGFDVRVGNTSTCSGVTIHGGTSSPGALGTAKTRSIILTRSSGTSIEGMNFSSYSVNSPVLVSEYAAGLVTGSVRSCHNSVGAVAVTEIVAGRDWDQPTMMGMTLSHSTGAAILNIDAPAGQQRTTRYRTGKSLRWAQGTDAIAESGSNVGTNWQIVAYSDTAAFIGTALTIYRSDLRVRIHGPLHHTGSTAGFFNTSPVARPTLPAAGTVTAADIRAALVTLGLCS